MKFKNILQEVAASLSQSTIKKCLHDRKYRGFTKCYKIATIKNRKARLGFIRKPFKEPTKLCKEKQNLPTICQTWWRQCCDTGMRADQWNKATSVY